MIEEKLFIAGCWRAANATLPVEDPSTGETIGTLAAGKASDIDAAVQAANAAFTGAWGKLTAAERGRVLARMSGLVRDKAEALAAMEARMSASP